VAQAQDALEYVRRGRRLEEELDFNGALDAYDEALSLDPKLAAAWSGRAWVLVRLHRMQEAMQASLKTLELAPDRAFFWKDHAILLNRLGRLEESLEAFRTAVEVDPMRPGLRLHLAQALVQMGRADEAVAQARRAVEIARAARDPHIYGKLASAGTIILQAGRPAQAVPLLEEAVALEPQRPLRATLERARAAAVSSP
jgi:tetratricopeptide (TPR) repeat protein